MECLTCDYVPAKGARVSECFHSFDTDISVEYHSVDGFTLWATDSAGYLVHRRFIGYTLREAKSLFRAELKGKVTT